MTTKPAPSKPTADETLAQEACERLSDARKQKTKCDQDLREGYYFAAPNRARQVSSQFLSWELYREEDADEQFTSFAKELSGDFVTNLINTFFPQGESWAMRKASQAIKDPQVRKQIEDQAVAGDAIIFGAIGESNFYPECGKGFNPDAALGTVAMWADQPSPSQPLKFMSVPLRELEINVRDGEVDDRFVVRHTRFKHIKTILPGVDIPQSVQADADKDKDKPCEVVRGFWRLYQDDGTVQWQYVAMVNETVVDKKVLKGDGSCPLIVARFNPSPEFAWGDGPLIQALEDLRMYDCLSMKRIRGIDFTIEPPVTYPSRSFTNLEEGLESGCAYPIEPGDQDAIKNIYSPPPQEPAIYFANDQEQRLKRLFFLDNPTQPGKTPPTATQWLDEMTMAQRRFGTPGLPFWWEFPAAIFVRAQYLLDKSGALPKLKLGNKSLANDATKLHPYNPAQKAIEQQKVAQFARFAQIAAGVFPEEWKLVSDGTFTIGELAKTMGVEDLWRQRNADDQKAIVGQLQQLQGGQAPNAPNVPDGQAAPPASAGAVPIDPQLSLRSQAA